mmetsp:Transcript_16620/g.45088  ORF Transcript_16620/g.45088 Transcript_16620/m.45088 type:complete len:89 (-) Transcript_16620:123-389(-)
MPQFDLHPPFLHVRAQHNSISIRLLREGRCGVGVACTGQPAAMHTCRLMTRVTTAARFCAKSAGETCHVYLHLFEGTSSECRCMESEC